MVDETKEAPAEEPKAEAPEQKAEVKAEVKAVEEKPAEKGTLAKAVEKEEGKAKVDDEVPEGHDPNPKVNAEGKAIDPKAAPEVKKEEVLEPYFPDDMADHLKGKDDKATIDNLAKAYKGARAEISKGGKVPENPADYKLSEEAAKVIDGDDVSLGIIQNIFHKHNISEEKFNGILMDIQPALKEAGLLPDLPTDEENMAALGKDGKAIVAFVAGKVAQIHKAGFLSDEEKAAVMSIGDTPAGITGLMKVFQSYGEKAVPVMDKKIDESLSDAELNNLLNDPRYNSNNPEYDPAYVAEVAAKYATRYGNKPSGVSPHGIAGGV